MAHQPMRAETDVLVIGSGAAGMYASIEAARAGCRVLLADRSLIGRGGATVMAQMTVAAALGSETHGPVIWVFRGKVRAGSAIIDRLMSGPDKLSCVK